LLHYKHTACIAAAAAAVVVGGDEPVNNTSVQFYHVNATMVTRALLSSNRIFRGALTKISKKHNETVPVPVPVPVPVFLSWLSGRKTHLFCAA
jgi:hypothetical protein